MPSFELIKSEQLFQGRTFKLRRDDVKMPDGRQTNLDIVEHGGSVVMVPVDEEGNIWFVQQYRHPAGMELLELPAGTRDGAEPPEICAAREMREETGMAASRLDKLGSFYLAPGYSTEFMVAFLAMDLKSSPLPGDEDEFIRVRKIPARAALEMALRGELQDAKSLAALFLARPKLEKYL